MIPKTQKGSEHRMIGMTPLQKARFYADILRQFGIRTTDYHLHVGENGTRCEFCGKSMDSKIHDPKRIDRGSE